MNAISSRARQHPVAAFVGLTYAISWAIWTAMIATSTGIATPAGGALNALAIAGPSIAAIVVAWALGGTRLRTLLAGLSIARLSMRSVVTALALPLLMVGVAIAAAVAFLQTAPPAFSFALGGIVAVEFIRILILGGPLREEIGWRGFALPRLQATRSAFDASTLLGVIWGLWHIPLYFVLGTGQFETLRAGTDPFFGIGGFVGWTIGLSILFTWLFNQTRGSLLVVMLFHGAVNLAVFLPAQLGSTGPVSLLNVAVTWVVALLVAARFGRATLAASSPRAINRDALAAS